MEVALPHDVYPLMQDMRRAFEQIMTLLQEDERRIRVGYELLQQERDAMGRDILAWHQRRASWPPHWGGAQDDGTEAGATAPLPEFTPDTPHERFRPGHTSDDEDEDGTDDEARCRREGAAAATATEGDTAGGTEVSLPAPVQAIRGRRFPVDDDVDAAASGLARLPTRCPATDNLRRSLSESTDEEESIDSPNGGDAEGRGRAHPVEGYAGLISPAREACRSPDGSARTTPGEGACAPDTFDFGSSTVQEELRLYAVPVRSKPQQRDAVADGIQAKVDLLRRSRHAAVEEEESLLDTLAESDHTTTLTYSSSQAELLVRRREVAGTSKGSAVPSRAVGAVALSTSHPLATLPGVGYAQQLRKRQPVGTKDASTITGASSLDRSLLHTMRSAGDNASASQGFWIHVWPCFGSFSATAKPARVYVYSHFRHIEDVVEKAADLLACRPAPQYFFEPNGSVARSLRQLVPEQHYLLFPSGGFYRQEAVPSALLREMVKAAQRTLTSRSS